MTHPVDQLSRDSAVFLQELRRGNRLRMVLNAIGVTAILLVCVFAVTFYVSVCNY
jgi:hypothetical protein